jgi:hypothetical protein
MSQVQKTDAKTPPCPVCERPTALKQIFRQQPRDHYIFKCVACAVESPVIGFDSKHSKPS